MKHCIVRQIFILAGSFLLITSAVLSADRVNVNFNIQMQTIDVRDASQITLTHL